MLKASPNRSLLLFFAAVMAASAAAPRHLRAQIPPPMPAEKTVQVFGQRIVFYEAGEGPNVILIHGLGADASGWMFNIGPLSEKYHVVALDQIGFGQSSKPLIDYKIGTFVDFLREFMKALGIPKATLVGNSLGGWIGADFAARYPAMVERLVLVDAAGLKPEGELKLPVDLNPATLEATRKVLEYIAYDKRWVSDQLVQQVFEKRLRNSDGYTIERVMAGIFAGNQYVDGELGSIHAPTLAVWGRNDGLTPLAMGERFEKGIAGAKIVVFDQCGHIPQMEKAAEFNRTLLEFLAQP
jgi:2-hydroxy-6-oxonona-2,4-dienedioate hydrolase